MSPRFEMLCGNELVRRTKITSLMQDAHPPTNRIPWIFALKRKLFVNAQDQLIDSDNRW